MHVRTRTWFGFVLVAGALLIAGSRVAFLEPIESAAMAAVAPVESALRTATRPVADFVNNLTDVNRLSDENQSLREENERLAAENARLREAQRELQEIQTLVNIRDPRPGDAFVEANVIAQDPSNVRDIVAINRGRDDGIEEGMIVLTPQGGLAGTVTRVLGRAAWVTLITDQSSAVSAFIQGSRVQGVVAGEADGTLTMEFVRETADLAAGDVVLTSGVGGRHPRGELMGQVTEVDTTGGTLFKEVRVQPFADFSQLESLLVLTSFLPVEVGQP